MAASGESAARAAAYGDNVGVPGEAETHTFVVADLAGYAALTEAHGDEQAADAAEEFCAAVRALLPAHGAQEVNTMGDGILLRVEEAEHAVELAQRIVSGYGATHMKLGVRAGIHTGTAVRRGRDWFGSAVNLTARVADRAKAGQILATEPAKRLLGEEIDLCPLGPQSFRNVPQALAVYEVVPDRVLPALPVDPVCRMAVDPAHAEARLVIDGIEYWLCSTRCARLFEDDPRAYIHVGPNS